MNALCLGLASNHADDLDYTPDAPFFDLACHMADPDSARFVRHPDPEDFDPEDFDPEDFDPEDGDETDPELDFAS